VFRIRDILVRIRICGSVPLTYRSGSDPVFFNWHSRFHQKLFILLIYYLLNVHLHQSSQIKVKRSPTTVEIKVFLIIFAEGFGSGSGRPKNLWIPQIRNQNTGVKHLCNNSRSLANHMFFSGNLGPLCKSIILHTLPPSPSQVVFIWELNKK
jgi:hypothetical protein